MRPAKNKHAFKQIVEQWKQAGPELERLRREELRRWQYDYRAVDALLDIGGHFGKSRPTSGLVEMQKWFIKLAGRRS